VRQVFAIPLPLADDGRNASRTTVKADNRLRWDDCLGVDVAAIPAPDRNCRYNLFIDDGTHLKKLDLPATTCVVMSQQFDASSGDMLSYDYVALLHSRGGFESDRPAVRAVLVNHESKCVFSLMDRSIVGYSPTHEQCSKSRFRESQRFKLKRSGHYELKFLTMIDRTRSGCEAHLLVNSLRLVNQEGKELKRLASLSCVGRVRRTSFALPAS
jgi:hypothetical protein